MPFNTRKQSHSPTYPLGFPATRWPALGGSGVAPGRAAYTGLVATRSSLPVSLNGGNKQMMTRTGHFSRAAITSMQVAWPGFTVGDGNITGVHTLTASIEYPAGTFTQVKFSTATSGTVPVGGTLLSDPISVSIPNNTKFWIRSFWSSTTQIAYHDNADTSGAGDACEFGASGVVDKTMSGTVATQLNVGYFPCAIIGTTTLPSLALIGDSICFGQGETFNGTDTGDRGILARSIGPAFGYLNFGNPGDQGASFLVNSAKRRALITAYCTHVITQYGFNDILNNSVTPTGMRTTTQSIASLVGLPTYCTTVTPRASSTNSWATTGTNQTTDPANGNRTGYNDLVRAAISGLAGYFETADVVESARNSGLWVGGYTVDGTHLSRTGYVAVVTANAVPTSTFS